MIECPMPKDILKYKSKFIANLSVREVSCGALGMGLGLICYFSWTSGIEAKDMKMLLSFLVAMPFFLIGFIKLYDQPFEKIVPTIVLDNFLSPAKKKKEIHYPEFEKYQKTRYWITPEVVPEEVTEEDNLGKKKKTKGKQKTKPQKIKIEKSATYKSI